VSKSGVILYEISMSLIELVGEKRRNNLVCLKSNRIEIKTLRDFLTRGKEFLKKRRTNLEKKEIMWLFQG
jgi:hypothetical protein